MLSPSQMVSDGICMTKSLTCPSSADTSLLNSRFLDPAAYSTTMFGQQIHISDLTSKFTSPQPFPPSAFSSSVKSNSSLPGFSAPNPWRHSQLLLPKQNSYYTLQVLSSKPMWNLIVSQPLHQFLSKLGVSISPTVSFFLLALPQPKWFSTQPP